ncbi:uncharacterized protein LOC111025405 [Momordica charantia]|uniref:Uncharacterized protein LOC111025405 n=1 Tax=Momordica charantia TaxID=3673 RepID=A0A6J1E2G6_MOMCH|nr:uncharacterized protein LOC111025405 [Momordica charantia]
MKFLTWNVRGLDSWKKGALIKQFISRLNPNVVILQETKLSYMDILIVKSLWSAHGINWSALDASGMASGILILWNDPDLKAAEMIEGVFSLTINFCLSDGFLFWVSGIYGPSTTEFHYLFWQELLDLSDLCENHWILAGDFNVTRWSWEKSNGRPLTKSMWLFNSFIEDSSLIDVPLTNGQHTWSRNTSFSLIDCFLLTNGCIDKLGMPIAKRMTRTTSDHFPILLDFGQNNWGLTPFRFENMWLSHKTFKPFLETWWGNKPLHGWPGHGLMMKLKSLKYAIKLWITEHFRCIHSQKEDLTNLMNSLDDLEGSQPVTPDQSRARIQAKEDLLSVVAKEEAFWRQRCKQKWLCEGDENTKFFHRFLANKRRRSIITEILSKKGIGLTQIKDIEEEFIDF